MAIHIHLARAAKPVRDADSESKKIQQQITEVESRMDKAIRGSTAYKELENVSIELGRKLREARKKENRSKDSVANPYPSGTKERAAWLAGYLDGKNGDQNKPAPGHYDIAMKRAFVEGNKAGFSSTKDSVESVEKEIRTQQRLIDVAKRMGKDVPGTVTQRMAFLKEELEKAKNPRTDDAEEFKSREEFKNVMLKSQDAFRAARNVVMLAGRAGDKGAAAKAQAIADLLDRAADMAHGLA